VQEQKIIVRTIHGKNGIPIPNVLQLKAGERILLVYRSKGKPNRPLFACTIGRSPCPIQTVAHFFEVFSRIDAHFKRELENAQFVPDPVVGGYTGIRLSETPNDLRDNPG
jgi:hypothetical protein